MHYRVEETAAKHERIVNEASRVFSERGFENVSLGDAEGNQVSLIVGNPKALKKRGSGSVVWMPQS